MAADDSGVKRKQGERQVYEPPAIEETSEFETLALTCLHNPGGQGLCDDEATGGESSS